MSSLVCLLIATALSADAASAAPPAAPSRRYTEIAQDVREALRAESRAETPEQQSAAVRHMAEIYREILADPRLPQSDLLRGHKARLWSRMTRIKQDLQRQQQRETAARAKAEDPQQLAALEQAAESLSEQMSLISDTMGGPGYVFQQGGGALGGGAVNDHGQELIELIERTIKPDFWDTNGGPGSMFYYRPLMALVVSATSEVHGNVGGLLGALRRAGQ